MEVAEDSAVLERPLLARLGLVTPSWYDKMLTVGTVLSPYTSKYRRLRGSSGRQKILGFESLKMPRCPEKK